MPKIRQADGTFIDVDLSAIFDDTGTNPFVAPVPPGIDPASITSNGQTFTADDMARARQEEKDKLYTRIEQLSQQVSEFTGTLTNREEAERARLEQEQQQAAAEAQRLEEQDMDARSLVEKARTEWQQQLDQTNAQWQQRFEQSEQERQAAEALAAKEREFTAVGEYARQQVEANQNNIAPQLLQFVTGNTREEIDQSVARAIQTTQEILQDIQGATPGQQPGAGQQFAPQSQIPAVSPYSGPGNVDPAGQQTQTYTPEQINKMTMTEYADFRRKIGVGGQGGNRGLYG